jgi:pectin methylesterase-like acyl-CoA thioesterase
LLILNAGLASAETLNVGQGQAYSTIQSAIDAAKNGDTILVGEGMYNENPQVE